MSAIRKPNAWSIDASSTSAAPVGDVGTVRMRSNAGATGLEASYNGVAYVPFGGSGAFPAGSGSELQFRSSGSAFGAVTGSTVTGASIGLAGDLQVVDGETILTRTSDQLTEHPLLVTGTLNGAEIGTYYYNSRFLFTDIHTTFALTETSALRVTYNRFDPGTWPTAIGVLSDMLVSGATGTTTSYWKSFSAAVEIPSGSTLSTWAAYYAPVSGSLGTITNQYGFIAEAGLKSGFGTTAPAEVVDVVGNLKVTPGSGGYLRVVGDAATFPLQVYTFSASQTPSLALLYGRGTTGSPTAAQSGDILGQVVFAGQYGSTVGNTATTALIRAEAAANFTSTTTVPTDLVFGTRATGSVAVHVGIRLASNRFVGIGEDIAATDITHRFTVIGTTKFNLGSDATGDVHYRAADGTFTRLGTSGRSAGDVLTLAGSPLLPTWAAGGSGTPKWNALTAPDGNLALTMAAYTTALTWNATTGTTTDLLTLQNTSNDTGTGALLRLSTPGTTNTKTALQIVSNNILQLDAFVAGGGNVRLTGASVAPTIEMFRAGGNLTTKSGVLLDTAVGILGFYAYVDATNTKPVAAIVAQAGAVNFDASNWPTGLMFRTSNSNVAPHNRMVITPAGLVGIGDGLAFTDVTAQLHVVGNTRGVYTLTAPAASTNYYAGSFETTNAASSSVANVNFYGVQAQVTSTTTSTAPQNLIGFYSHVTHQVASNAGSLIGFQADLVATAAGTVTSMTGILMDLTVGNPRNITQMNGIRFALNGGLSGSTVTAAYGILIDAQPGLATFTNYYGLYLMAATSGFGNKYGLVVEADGGNSGFGLINPSAKLHVSGSVRFDLGSDAAGDSYSRSTGGNLERTAIGTLGQVWTVTDIGAGVLRPRWGAGGGGGMTVPGSGTELQYRSSGTALAAVAGSSVTSNIITLTDGLVISGAAGLSYINVFAYGSTVGGTNFVRVKGTAGSPTAVTTGDVLGGFGYFGQYSTTIGQFTTGAYIQAIAAGTFSSTSNKPTNLVFATSSSADVVGMILTSASQVVIGAGVVTADAVAQLTVKGDVKAEGGNTGYVLHDVGGTNTDSYISQFGTFLTQGELFFQKASGTQGSPGNAAATDALGTIIWQARNSGSYATIAQIAVLQDSGGNAIQMSCGSNLFAVYSNSCQLNIGSDAPGDTYHRDTAGRFVRGAIGTVGQVWTVTDIGAGVLRPRWGTGGGGMTVAGSGTELQYRSSGTVLAALSGSSISGANLSLGGDLTISPGRLAVAYSTTGLTNWALAVSHTLTGSNTQGPLYYANHVTLVDQSTAGTGTNSRAALRVFYSRASAADDFGEAIGVESDGLFNFTGTLATSYIAFKGNCEIQGVSGVLSNWINFYAANESGFGTATNAYGFIAEPGLFSGFGTITPTATLHVSGTVKLALTGTNATGDIHYRNSGGFQTQLAIGTLNQVLKTGAFGVPIWAAPDVDVFLENSGTAAISNLQTYDYQSTSTPAVGFGGRITYRLESSTTASRDAVFEDWRWQIATDASRTAVYSIKTATNGDTPKERMLLGGYKAITNNTRFDVFTVSYSAADHKAVAGTVFATIMARQTTGSNQIQVTRFAVPFLTYHNAASNSGSGVWGAATGGESLQTTGGPFPFGITYSVNTVASPTAATGASSFTFQLTVNDTSLSTFAEYWILFDVHYSGQIDIVLA